MSGTEENTLEINLTYSPEGDALTCLPVCIVEKPCDLRMPLAGWSIRGSGWTQFLLVTLFHAGWPRARAVVQARWRNGPDMDEVVLRIEVWGTPEEGVEERKVAPDQDVILVRDCMGSEPGPWTLMEEWNRLHPEEQL